MRENLRLRLENGDDVQSIFDNTLREVCVSRDTDRETDIDTLRELLDVHGANVELEVGGANMWNSSIGVVILRKRYDILPVLMVHGVNTSVHFDLNLLEGYQRGSALDALSRLRKQSPALIQSLKISVCKLFSHFSETLSCSRLFLRDVLRSCPSVDVNECSGDPPRVPLFYAMAFKIGSLLDALLAHRNIDVNCSHLNVSQRPLYHAIVTRRIDYQNMILNHPQFDLQAVIDKPHDHFTLLCQALDCKQSGIASNLLEHWSADFLHLLADSTTRLWRSSLMLAGETFVDRLFEILDDQLCDTNCTYFWMLACKVNRIDHARRFAGRFSVDLFHKDLYGHSALWLAISLNYDELVTYLLEECHVNKCEDAINALLNYVVHKSTRGCSLIFHVLRRVEMSIEDLTLLCCVMATVASTKDVHHLVSLFPDIDINAQCDVDLLSNKDWLANHNYFGNSVVLALTAPRHTLDIVKVIFSDSRVDLDQCDKFGLSVLHHATRNPPLFMYLVEEHSDRIKTINPTTLIGESVLHTAVKNSFVPHIIQYLSSNSLFDLNGRNQNGDTALHMCVQQGQIQQMLEIKRGLGLREDFVDLDEFNPNLLNNLGYTPLIIAVLQQPDDGRVVGTLLSLPNIDVDAQSFDGTTPLWELVNKSADNILNRRFSTSASNSINLKLLIEAGANVNIICGERGDTPLMLAARAGDVTTLKYLVEVGQAIISVENAFGESALTLAWDHPVATTFLLSRLEE